MQILVSARSAGLQAIDGPYLLIKDLAGLRTMAERAKGLGYDGKWAVHPSQLEVVNEVFTPSQEDYDKAEATLELLRHAHEEEDRGAVMFGTEMIDEASRKMAIQFAERGRAALYADAGDRLSPARSPRLTNLIAILRDASSIISSPSITAPRRPPASDV